MISFFNTFITYLILVIASGIIMVAGVFAGKKLRDIKDNKDAAKAENIEEK